MSTAKINMEDYSDFADLAYEAGVAIMVKGAPGIGKTKGLETRAKTRATMLIAEGGYGYFEVNLANVNVADFQGYMMPESVVDVDHEGNEIRLQKGEFTYPFFLRDKFSGLPAYRFKHGQIVIEEYGQGGSDEKKAVQQLVEEHRIGRWHFPQFDIALLSNRDIDRAGVTKDFDHAINRRAEVELVPTLKSLLVYAAGAGWTNMTMAFAARNEKELFESKVPEKQGPWLTPRSLEKLDALMQAAERQGRKLDDAIVQTGAAALVGLGSAGTYLAFVNARSKIPTVSSIVKDPEGSKIPDDLDVTMFLIFDLASKTTRENMKPISQYVKRLPSSMSVTYFNALTNRDRSLVMTREFTEFAVDNLDLLTAVAARSR